MRITQTFGKPIARTCVSCIARWFLIVADVKTVASRGREAVCVPEPARHRATCSHVWSSRIRHTERTPDRPVSMATSEQFRSIAIMLVACRAVYTSQSPRIQTNPWNLELLGFDPGNSQISGSTPNTNWYLLRVHPSQVLILHRLAVMHRQTPTSEPIT